MEPPLGSGETDNREITKWRVEGFVISPVTGKGEERDGEVTQDAQEVPFHPAILRFLL